MKRRDSTQYTLRQVPPEVDDALRRRARAERKSLNAVALEALKTGLLLNGEPVCHHDLDFLIGSWVEDPEFDAAIRAQDQVDPDLWR
jgi:hypothetical protein